ncbi:MAG: DNA polymerase I [Candidatus Eremiobacteraeota bacterium]|nr:DNA polymerase I [Candidatus Eremiobacteraeota bacterium]MBV8499546.1 DNA polymerase I [Candidatus Eremiobacteraeota bacterium]
MALMLLDTYGLVYRAFFALPPLNTAAGTPINAVYGFTMMLNKLIADEKPTHIIAAFDKGMPVERVALYAEYKAQRRVMPDELRGQFGLVRRVLDTFRIPIVEIEGQEADDVIATLARQAEEEGEQTLVVTGDLDLLQIVDERTTVLTTRRGITELGRYDPAAVRERFGLEPAQLPDFRGLKGDPSDNLPGIPGVGEKTASRLLQAAGSLDALVANPALAGSPKLEKLIEQFGQQACLCRAVSMVRRDLPLPIDWESCRYAPPADGDLYHLYSELEFKTLLSKLAPPPDLPLFESGARLKGNYRSYVPSADPPEFERLASELSALADAPRVVFALAGDAVGVSAKAGEAVSFGRGALARTPVRAALERIFASKARVGAYDAKRLLHALSAAGLPDATFSDDAMIAAHLLDPSRGFAQAEDAAKRFLGVDLPDDAAAHADAAFALLDKGRAELEARGQLSLYEDVEVPLAPVLARMESAGVTIDPRELATVGAEVDAAATRLQKQIHDFAGEDFNIGSPQQLGNVLFGKLQIPGGKKTKTGWATGVEVLQGLAREYPICALVLEWREVTKLKNTYVDVIPRLVDARDGRLRTEFNQTATATGRLSSTNPNLQNIPVRGELGRRIRRAFVARDDDHVLLAADYSQIELRLMAHLSGDAAMRAAFHESADIHDFTARQIFNVPPERNVDANQRRMAKSVNFGLFYGMSDFGLAQRLEISRAEAKEITTAYFARFPDVRAYIERTIEEGRRTGYVSTILGRRRYMPGLISGNYMLRAAAEREATNAPLQGSAADLMKLAMVRIDRALREAGLDAVMLLQIHDELIFEVRKEDLKRASALVRDHMEHAAALSVPLEVTLKAARNWYDVEPMDEEAFERV